MIIRTANPLVKSHLLSTDADFVPLWREYNNLLDDDVNEDNWLTKRGDRGIDSLN